MKIGENPDGLSPILRRAASYEQIYSGLRGMLI